MSHVDVCYSSFMRFLDVLLISSWLASCLCSLLVCYPRFSQYLLVYWLCLMIAWFFSFSISSIQPLCLVLLNCSWSLPSLYAFIYIKPLSCINVWCHHSNIYISGEVRGERITGSILKCLRYLYNKIVAIKVCQYRNPYPSSTEKLKRKMKILLA